MISEKENLPSAINYYNIIANDNSQVFLITDKEFKITDGIKIAEIEKQLKEIYNLKKADNIRLSKRYDRLGMYAAERDYYTDRARKLERCSEFLEFAKIENKYKLIKTNLCRQRLCPMCQYKRSVAVFRNVREIHKYIDLNYPRSKFLFVTLTIENVQGPELKNAIDGLNRGVQNIVRHKDFKKINLGMLRTIEITYNKKTGKYHPHVHMLVHTTNDIYSGRNYISQQKLTEMWKSAAGLDYTPIVDIRRFRANTGRELAEVAKYSVKPSDYLSAPDSVIMILDDVLYRRKLLTASGSFREAKAALKIKELEEKEDYKEQLKDIEGEIILYRWHFGEQKYKLVEESVKGLLKTLDFMQGKMKK